MKRLIYLASSGYNINRYNRLPFDQIYLVDYIFRTRIKVSGKLILLGMEAVEAIKYLKKQNLKFDCLVILNEGLGEGGGLYPLHSDVVLGFIMPILNETYIHIMSPKYY